MRVEVRLRSVPAVFGKTRLRKALRVALKESASRYKEMVLDYIDEGKAFRRRTGVLRASIVAVENTVVAVAPYAPFVELGTRPHVIFPKNKKALRFFKDGKEIFAKKVRHPGSKPYPFMFAEMEKRAREVGRHFLKTLLEET